MTLEVRYHHIMHVMTRAEDYMTASQICSSYLKQHTTSDKLSTQSILNVLTHAGIVTKKFKPRGEKAFYTQYKLVV